MDTFRPDSPLDAALLDAVGDAVTGFLDHQAGLVEEVGAQPLLDLARTFTAGGKRLRPAFCFWGHVAAAGPPADAAALLRAAASLDLLHVSALVHDDLIDASDLRRGQPAAHRQFAHQHIEGGGTGSADDFGSSAAILLGDLLVMWSVEMFETSGLPAAQLAHARPLLHAMRSEVTCGQYLDLAAANRVAGSADLAGGLQVARRILEFKSARYSVARPTQVGAALGGANDELLRTLGEFGSALGRAFQLRDDVLGVFGDPAVTGKPAGDDLAEGKRTLLVLTALTSSDAADAAELEALLGSPLDEADCDRARRIIEDSGARAHVEDQINQLTGYALQRLDQARITPEGRTALTRLAEMSTRRDR